MAEITIRMIFNTNTGKKDILIDFESDEDALPFEHEKRHRQIIQQLLGKGILRPDELGEVIVQRGQQSTAEETPTETPNVVHREAEALANQG